MLLHNLGYPRIGEKRQLKWALEKYWAGKIDDAALQATALNIKKQNWLYQAEAGIDLIPCNDYSLYDHVLDTCLMLGVVPPRFEPLQNLPKQALYFAMARGLQNENLDIKPLEMTKWFDTNYHYLVPEFLPDQKFKLDDTRIIEDFELAKSLLGKKAKPVLLGPLSFLLLGKEKAEFDRIELIDQLVPLYSTLLNKFSKRGAEWIQIDEPVLVLDLSEKVKAAFQKTYQKLAEQVSGTKVILTTYFEGLGDNLNVVLRLPVQALHVDLVRDPDQLESIIAMAPSHLLLSLGLIDGRNIWKNDYRKSLTLINRAIQGIGSERLLIAPSCSLLHCPNDLELETKIDSQLKGWMAFAKQKLQELNDLKQIIEGETHLLEANTQAIQNRKSSLKVNNSEVRQRLQHFEQLEPNRTHPFPVRKGMQREQIPLPLFPTTTIGSLPQTDDLRQIRAKLKKGELSSEQYKQLIQEKIVEAIHWQEEIGLDVLVHGEFERNDMVEYFGELLGGFVITEQGWVQSYGSRCVKPPIIYGDVYRSGDMTVEWITFAASQTQKPVKGMLTGPVTLLQWSFCRDDQPRAQTAFQIALAIRDEVLALEKAGIKIIQIDEAALREGLPLRTRHREDYLKWAVRAFKLCTSGVRDSTQIHTHMCYSYFNDIIESIAAMDADVITIETSRSQMDLLEVFSSFKYPNEIGPGVYDIHSPRVPRVDEMVELLQKATERIPLENLWVNPDCGLKTRNWPETKEALRNMVQAAKLLSQKFS